MTMTTMAWLSALPPFLTLAVAIWSGRIIPSILVGILLGGYLRDSRITGASLVATIRECL
ncbi:MAG: hypothetical protein ABI910_21600 [Gemmatimonadota bacterium]